LNNGMGGGIPPQVQGQMTPQMLGLPQQVDPLMYQQLVNGGMPPQDEMNALMGQPR
jgi:hypothetical protein